MTSASPFFRSVFGFCYLVLVLLQGCASSEDAPSFNAQGGDEIVKSPNDAREYRALELRNGMKVVLVSDPTSEKAAVSVDVNAGSNSDTPEFAGLAHFLEHMLFLGTEKYPEAGEYQAFISSHGGSHNAYTAFENTNYFFDIDKAWLEPALDRFSQFFIAPLFTAEYVDRERNAVHSEYQSGLQDDGRRNYSVLKAVINPAHPMAGFAVGSLDTLRDQGDTSLRDALLAHYERYYSANLMTAAILGSQSLDELEVLARRYFEPVENRSQEPPATDEPLFIPGSLPAMVAVEPVRDTRSLTYTFPIPVVREFYKSKPINYLGNMLGHEGEGSLLAVLRSKGWANALSAGSGFSHPNNATFTVVVSLTEAGVERVNEITALLFQFIGLVREQGIAQWRFDEQKQMAELGFRFQEPAQPVGWVSALSRRLQDYPPSDLITAPFAYETFDPDLLVRILDSLRPNNVLLTLISRSVEGNQVDPWYGASYLHRGLALAEIYEWTNYPSEDALALAEPNPFLPQNLAIKPYEGSAPPPGVTNVAVKPDLLVNSNGVRLWFKQDNEFLTPRANFHVYAMTPLFNDSLHNSLLSSFVVSLVNDRLNEFSYPANLAGAYFGLSHRSRGFTLTVGGYNDKQPELLQALLQALVTADFEQERFDIIKAEMIRNWQNAALQTPYVRLFQEAQALLVTPYWPESERIAAVRQITLDDVRAFVPRMLANLRIDALYHGNVVASDATAMLDIVTRYLHTDPAAPVPDFGSVIKLPADMRIVQELEVAHDDSAIVIYMQGQDDTLKTRATISLLANILRTPFYAALRTEQQLGYIVNAGTLPILKTNGLVLYIESPVADPLQLEASIDAFLAGYASELAAMDPVVFNDIKTGILTGMRQPAQRLNALSGRYWGDVLVEEYTEDSTLQMADAIEALTHADVVAWYNARVASPDAGRLVARSAGRTLMSQYLASRLEAPGTVILDDGDADYRPFKQSQEQFEF